jgi:hypothetical protein
MQIRVFDTPYNVRGSSVEDPSNLYEAPRSELPPPVTENSPRQRRGSLGFVGAMVVPAIMYIAWSYARIGPMGVFWVLGKGDDTVWTPLGRLVASILIVVGGLAGAACGTIIDGWHRQPDPASGQAGSQ